MFHGILNVYKEKGYTSHDVVAKIRGITGQKKVGHTGTLDPEAEGVLPVCLGKATKVSELLTEKDKTYRTVLLLGVTTDTQDMTGTVTKTCSTKSLSPEAVEEAIQGFAGSYEQVPPMYSALKVGGKKLYELAREGKTVERKGRVVWIHHIQILRMDLPRVEMEVTCSKGTYIRTLCQDIGDRLGTGGCMESLLRTASGPFRIADSHSLEEIQKKKETGDLEDLMVPVDLLFQKYEKVQIGKDLDKRLKNGNILCIDQGQKKWKDREHVRVYDSTGNFAAIYQYVEADQCFRIVKMFLQ